MALIAYMSGLPVFSNYLEAVAWGQQYGLTGAHKHLYGGQVVYMPGETHAQITSIFGTTTKEVETYILQNTPSTPIVTTPIPTPTPPPTVEQTPQTPSGGATGGTGGSTGGGGGGGY